MAKKRKISQKYLRKIKVELPKETKKEEKKQEKLEEKKTEDKEEVISPVAEEFHENFLTTHTTNFVPQDSMDFGSSSLESTTSGVILPTKEKQETGNPYIQKSVYANSYSGNADYSGQARYDSMDGDFGEDRSRIVNFSSSGYGEKKGEMGGLESFAARQDKERERERREEAERIQGMQKAKKSEIF